MNDVRILDIREERHHIFSVVIELDQKLSVEPSPDSYSAILASSEDVVLVCVNSSNCSTVSIGDLPLN